MVPRPVKCCPSASRTSFLFHLFGFLINCVGVYSTKVHYVLEGQHTFGGEFKYFTMISMYIAFFATGYATLIDMIQLLTGIFEDEETCLEVHAKSSLAFWLRDQFMTVWVFVSGITVVILYNTIAIIDTDAIHPVHLQELIPLFGWYNIFLHGYPLVYNIAAVCLVNYRYMAVKFASILLFLFGAFYLIWMIIIKNNMGEWPYPFMDEMSDNQILIFVGVDVLLSILIYLVELTVASRFWNSKRQQYAMKAKAD